jgi:glucosylceramidase
VVSRPLIVLAAAAGAAVAATAIAATLAARAPASPAPAPAPVSRHDIVSRAASSEVRVWLTTANLRERLSRMPNLRPSAAPPAGRSVIEVNEAGRYQTIKGFGAAMTDTSSWLIHDQLDAAAQTQLMDRLFGAGGIHLNFIRVPIGASDFSATRRPYSYDDLPAGRSDPTLGRFSIQRDTQATLPLLQQAATLDPSLFVLANPWSPPGWMKTNDALDNLRDRAALRASDYGALAAYFVKFLQAYADAGIHVGAVTPQNEPGQSSAYPGMHLTEAEEAAFVRHDLVPALTAAGLGGTAIYGYDWGWARKQIRYAFSLARSAAAADLTGISTHCYIGDPSVISALHREAPGLDEIVDECSPGIMPAPTAAVAIAALRNWASVFALWNLALDPAGGPVQSPNIACRHCSGVVTIDESTHRVTLTRTYYELGQFSKFVASGAVRIGSTSFVRYRYPAPAGISTQGLADVAFQNPDGSRVLVAYNSSRARRQFAVADDGRYFSYALDPGATATFTWS